MIANVKYLWYVLRHKYYVFIAGRRLGVGYWQLLVHDLSKFSRAEWKPYVDNFFREKRNSFKQAVIHHYRNNPHHWQYWSYSRDVRTSLPLDYTPEIPVIYVKEMVADWLSAGKVQTGSWNINEWYYKNENKRQLNTETKNLVHSLIAWYNVHYGEVNNNGYSSNGGCTNTTD